MTDELPVIPRMGTPKMHMIERSRVIGWVPKPETRGTEWRQAGREVFGETIKGSQRQSDRSHYRPVAGTPAAGPEPRGRPANRRDRHRFFFHLARMVQGQRTCA